MYEVFEKDTHAMQQPKDFNQHPGYPQPGYPQPGCVQLVTTPPMTGSYKSVPQDPQSNASLSIVWMASSLHYLDQLDELLVEASKDIIIKFSVNDNLGQKLYSTVDDSFVMMKTFFGPLRPFDLTITDNAGIPVIFVNRPLRCDGCCYPCCLQTLDVTSHLGTVLGCIEQNWSFWYPNFSLKNAAGDTVLRIEGPFCTRALCTCRDVEFLIYSADKKEVVGKITHPWIGCCTKVEKFEMVFPMELDVNIKATLLGAVFLIYALYV